MTSQQQQTNSSNRQPQDNPASPSLMNLPSELHVYLLSFLDFRALQMLRSASTYFHELPTDAEIARSRAQYVRTLQKLEVEEVKQAIRDDGTTSSPSLNDQYLTCYTCFCRRPITSFTNTQITRRRTKGHADAYKRFCKDCAILGDKWEPGIILSFPDRDTIYCRRCRDVRTPPRNEWLRVFGLCEECRVRTGILDVHPPKEGVPAVAWYETRRLVDGLYGQCSHGRVPVPEGEWKRLEEELRALRLDQELLSTPL